MKNPKNQSNKSKATEKLDVLMHELATKIDSGASVPGSCRRIYCV